MLPLLRNLGWLYRWLLAALTDAAVSIPWLILLYSSAGVPRWSEGLPPAWMLLLPYLAAAAWERGNPGTKGAGGWRRVITVVIGMAASYLIAWLALPTALRGASLLGGNLAFWFLPVAGYLWYQGARMGGEGVFHAGVFQRFIWQCFSLAGGIVLLTLLGTHRNQAAGVYLYWSVPLLALSGLTLLALTREQAMRADQARQGEEGTGGARFSRVTGGFVLVLLLITLLASYVVSAERLAASASLIVGWVAVGWNWLSDVFMLIFYRYALMLDPVMTALIRWIQSLRREPEPQDVGAGGSEPFELPNQEPVSTAELMPYLRAALLIGFLVLLGVWLYRLNFRRREEGTDEEERISLGFWASLLADLKALLGLARRKAAIMQEAAVQTVAPEQLDSRDPRVLFRRMQAWGQRIGRTRQASETPNRYRQVLTGARPGAAEEVSSITEVYNQARYGAAPPAGEAVQRAVRAVDELRKHEEREA